MTTFQNKPKSKCFSLPEIHFLMNVLQLKMIVKWGEGGYRFD